MLFLISLLSKNVQKEICIVSKLCADEEVESCDVESVPNSQDVPLSFTHVLPKSHRSSLRKKNL